jgi:GAF domain-containing protein
MLLEPMLSRLALVRDLPGALKVALRDFVALHGAEMGDLQLAGRAGDLVIAEALGVSRDFLAAFRHVSADSGSVCGRAARDRAPVFIPDVTVEPGFEELNNFSEAVAFRSVLSCPLIASDGQMIGMLSALSVHGFSPTSIELEAARAYCVELVKVIERLSDRTQRAQWAEDRADALLEATGKRTRKKQSSTA